MNRNPFSTASTDLERGPQGKISFLSSGSFGAVRFLKGIPMNAAIRVSQSFEAKLRGLPPAERERVRADLVGEILWTAVGYLSSTTASSLATDEQKDLAKRVLEFMATTCEASSHGARLEKEAV